MNRVPPNEVRRRFSVAVGSVSLRHAGAARVATKTALEHSWHQVAGEGWQIIATATEDPAETDMVENTRGDCPVGMVEVRGRTKTVGSVDLLDEYEKTTCTEWISLAYPERCAVFDEAKWHLLSRSLPTEPMHFCIDRFEYPDRKGSYPVVAVTWREAGELCRARSERLCSEAEWTLRARATTLVPIPKATGVTRTRA